MVIVLRELCKCFGKKPLGCPASVIIHSASFEDYEFSGGITRRDAWTLVQASHSIQ